VVERDSPPDTLALLQRALDRTQSVIAAIKPDQDDLPTPCSEWNVRQLVAHLAPRGLRNFTLSARGEMPDWRAPAEEPGEDWAAAFAAGARELMETWNEADLDRPVPIPGGEAPLRGRADQQLAEVAIHGWDLARATGQPLDLLDPDVARHALSWSQRMLRPEHRGPGRAFGLEVAVPEDAPVQDRLAGWFGRDPHWTASAVAREG
jgi:uncharacterized protein (TIGR03086 family)